MAAATPTEIPTEFAKGTTLRWAVSDSDYPANEGWVKSYYLRGPSSASVTAATYSDTYHVAFTATVTAAMTSGHYEWQEFSSKGSLRFLSARGHMELLDDLQDVSTSYRSHEGRTKARQMLDALERLLTNEAVVSRAQPDQLAQWIETWNRLKFEVRRDEEASKRAGGGVTTDTLYARFVSG